MSELLDFSIKTNTPTQEFKNFIDQDRNDRIIFSGIFGIGKTSFLNKFFEVNSNYIALHLYPTNYSVASNEDIFELIKIDILYELLEKKVILDKDEISTWDALKYVKPQEAYKIFKGFIKLIPDIGEKVTNILDPLETLIEEINKIKKNNSTNDGKEIKKLFEDIGQTKGSIYENDFYTQLITKLISKLKDGDKKKIVLVVDDLDRIDPEHIFRIINIFAVHFDATKEQENKFGLDKIILSCDINNIREIFKHKYGGTVDFNGYIDKFYSSEIFKFDNKEEIKKILEGLVSSIECFPESLGKPNWQNEKSHERMVLVYLLNSFIFSNRLNLRSLKKLKNSRYQIPLYYMRFPNNPDFVNSVLPLLQIFDFLVYVFGSLEGFKEASHHFTLNDFKISHESVKYAFASFILYLNTTSPNLNAVTPRNNRTLHYRFRLPNGIEINFGIKNDDNEQPRVRVILEDDCTYEQFIDLFQRTVNRYVAIRNNQY